MRRRTWAPAAAAVLVAVAGGALVASGAEPPAPAAQEPPANTAEVRRGELSAMVSLHGTLTYRAGADGSPYSAINRARGIYTKLPAAGDEVGCGDVLYRVDDEPVLLLCGAVPAYRDLDVGDEGRDVRQLNRNLRELGYDAGGGREFTSKTEQALEKLHDPAFLFLPGAVRIARVTGRLGGSVRPGAEVLQATSGTPEVQVDLGASQQRQVKVGDRARITLPGQKPVTGTVNRLGRVARTAGKDDAGNATIPAYISLGKPKAARGLDRAPVQVEITTKGVGDALSVPVTALVGKSGGGFAVEVVRDGGRRELVAVELGLFDTASGRVQVTGDLEAGDRVVVPAL